VCVCVLCVCCVCVCVCMYMCVYVDPPLPFALPCTACSQERKRRKFVAQEIKHLSELAKKDMCGRNVLHLATERGHLDVMEALLRLYDSNSRDDLNWTPLHVGAAMSFVGFVLCMWCSVCGVVCVCAVQCVCSACRCMCDECFCDVMCAFCCSVVV
jgi:Ankyrin repeats (3 copies)